MKRLFRYLAVPAILLLVAVGIAKSLFTRVPPHTIAVRQDNWGGGIEQRDFGAGYHFGLKGQTKWHFLDGGTRVLHFSEEDDGPFRLEIRTKDNNAASIAATVTYRIRPGQGWRVVAEGLERDYPGRIRSEVESRLRRELADLSSEEWFDFERRGTSLAAIREKLDSSLAQEPLEVTGLFIRDIAFSEAYERKLQEKQILHQRERLIEARTALSRAEQRVEEITEETNRLVQATRTASEQERQELRAAAESEVAQIRASTVLYDSRVRAEADTVYQRELAEGQLAMEEAKALGDRLHLESLNGEGGAYYLARKAANNLEIESVTLNSNDPAIPSVLDLHALARLLVDGESD